MGEWRPALRCLRALVRMELLRMLRTPELWSRMVLPMLLAPLVMGAVAVVYVASLVTLPEVLALERPLPPELGILDALEGSDWAVVLVDDAAQAVARGEADVGLGGWRQGAGLSTRAGERVAWVDEAPAALWVVEEDRAAWHVDVWGGSGDRELQWLRWRLGRHQLQAWLAASGADPALAKGPRRVYEVAAPDAPPPGPRSVSFGEWTVADTQVLLATLSVISLSVACLFLGSLSAADRLDGTLETIAASAAPRWAIVAARVVAWVVVVSGLVAVVALPFAPILTVDLLGGEAWVVGRLGGVVVVASCAAQPVGLLARSVEEAGRLGTLAMGGGGVLAAGVVLLPPLGAAALTAVVVGGTVLGLARSPGLTRPAAGGRG